MKAKDVKRLFLIKTAALLLALCLASSPILSSAGSVSGEDVVMVCANIGKADCILIKGGDFAYLIDTGYEQSWPALLKMLEQYGVTALDGVFLTHCHKDHYGSLMLLAQSDIPVGAWYAAEIYYDMKASKHPLMLAAKARGEEPVWLAAGDVIAAGSGASFTVLGPLTANTDNENNNSLVMRFECSAGSILLCGDMKEEEEYSLLSAGLIGTCDILKCGHHGDSGATSKALLASACPSCAVICTATGEEADTPSPKVLQRLYSIGAEVWVTQDAADALEFRLGDGGITVNDISWDGVPAKAAGIEIGIFLDDDVLTVSNTSGSDITVADAVLYSSKGTELYSLGDILIPANGTLTIGSAVTTSECDLCAASKKRIWHASSLDIAVLYDQWGRPLAWADNGMPE